MCISGDFLSETFDYSPHSFAGVVRFVCYFLGLVGS